MWGNINFSQFSYSIFQIMYYWFDYILFIYLQPIYSSYFL